MSNRTESEKLFEQFCKDNGIEFSRLDPAETPESQCPDYEIKTADGPVIVEVKQFDPNEEDRQNARLLEERGYGKAIGGAPGARVRLKIQSGTKQLKVRSQGKVPTVLVLYNNVPFNSRGTHPYEIKTAMYGIEKIDLAVGKTRVAVVDRGFGPKRKLTPSDNTSLSAVATLLENLDGDLVLSLFHNIYASRPLTWQSLNGPKIAHFTIGEKEPGKFQEWTRLDVTLTA